MSETTRELVLAVVGGDVHRFAEIVQRYDVLVRRTIARAVSDGDTREELVQQTFYQAFKNLGGLRHPDQLEAWLIRIAERRLAQHIRAASRRSAHEKNAARPVEEPSERPTWVWEEAARLPPSLADILFLRYRMGLDYGEISERLSVPLSTVRGRLYEARKRLRTELEKRGLHP
ncbi:MAG: sigma-70 family RNA polymerase sigma factor [Planctomycetota bacterium]